MSGRNIYWKDISTNDTVIDCETHWKVYNSIGVCKGVAFWEGDEQAKAQAFLRERSEKVDVK